jgi:stearoyl-CoA desaturase (delta-9 desaturase)
MGRRRFPTADHSRNSWLLTFITLGEGWHNNHHRYMHTVRQGFYWWEFDPTYYGLRLLALTGFIWDLKPVPPAVLAEAAQADQAKAGAATERELASLAQLPGPAPLPAAQD